MQILSGVFEGLTTGAPIGLLIANEDARSKDYGAIKDLFRPGHADFTYFAKYGIRDYRGGGRSSARETAVRVAAGAIARKVLGAAVRIRGALVQMGPHGIDRDRWDWDETGRNPFWCPDAHTAETWAGYLDGVRKSASSTGGIVEVIASGVPVGLGAPVFDRLDADIAKAMVSIPAVKGVEIGAGFACRRPLGAGEQRRHADEGRPAGVSVQQRRRRAGRHFHRPGHRRPRRDQADQFGRDAAADRQHHAARRSISRPPAATIRASPSAACRSARRCWPACSPITCCATRPSADRA